MANPFADTHSRLDSNPFDDPTVNDAMKSTQSLSQWTINEDEDQPTPRIAGANTRSDDTASRLEEIRQREAALADRERNLNAREDRVRNYGKNNWPPFFPLIFMDIQSEIPEESRVTVLTLYRVWMLLGIVLVVNLVACILMLVAGRPDGAKDMGAAIMYLPVIGILSFLLWYRPIYNAYMKEHAFFYYLFFVFGGFHLAFSAYMIVGIPSTGSGGLINLIGAFATGSIVTGVFCAIATAGWVMQMLGLLWEYRAIWAHFNNKGHNFEQAKSELRTAGIMAYLSRGSKV